MGRALADFKKVQGLRSADPSLSITQAIKQAGVSYSSYYAGRKAARNEPPADDRKTAALVLRHTPTREGLVRLVIGTAAQIREVLA